MMGRFSPQRYKRNGGAELGLAYRGTGETVEPNKSALCLTLVQSN